MNLQQVMYRHRGKVVGGALFAIGVMLLILVNGRVLFFATLYASSDKSQEVMRALHLQIPDALAVPDVVDTLVEHLWDRGSHVLMENLMQRDSDVVANYIIRKAKLTNSATDKCRLLYIIVKCKRSRAVEIYEKSWFIEGVSRSDRIRGGFGSLLRGQRLVHDDEFDPIQWAQLVEDLINRPEVNTIE